MQQISKPLVIAYLMPATLSKHGGVINYEPGLGPEDMTRWKATLAELKPHTIIFGTGFVTADMLQQWRSILPEGNLRLIRKGVTLARCDLASAAELGISVENTPGANAPHVAKFICDIILASPRQQTCAVLGIGKIGTIVARTLAEQGHRLNVISRRLAHPRTKEGFLRESGLIDHNVSCPTSITESFQTADAIAITLPFTQETKGLIDAENIHAIPQRAKFISTSFPQILTDDALRALHARDDIDVTFDHLEKEFAHVIDILGVSAPRSNFIMAEKAAATIECQIAMDEAALKLAAEKKTTLPQAHTARLVDRQN